MTHPILTLGQTLAANARAAENDVQETKHALNALGYYIPDPKIGISEIPDQKLFDGIRHFQADHQIPVTGSLRPKDKTVEAINTDLKQLSGTYIWRTVGDERVRPEHQGKNGQTFTFNAETGEMPGEAPGCRCWLERSKKSDVPRKEAILGKGKADFSLKPDSHPLKSAPWYKLNYFSEVQKYESIIQKEAQNAKVSPDLIKAIIYVETTQGYYDRFLTPLDANKSIRPMNIQSEYWKNLGYSREDLKKPELNIRAGTELIKRIQAQMPNAKLEEIATIYNDLNAKMISDYGQIVARAYKEKPWLNAQ